MFPFPTIPPVRRPYPTIITDSSNGATSSSASATTPAGDNGDLLLFFVSVIAGSGARTITTPTGFTQIYNEVPTSATYHRRAALYSRTADGTEGSSITASLSGTSEWTVVILRIRDWSDISASSAVNSTATSVPNPPSHTASWGSTGNLWLAAVHSDDTVGTAPSGYTLSEAVTVSDSSMTVAYKNLSAATDDPGTFGTAAAAWYSTTIVVKPD